MNTFKQYVKIREESDYGNAPQEPLHGLGDLASPSHSANNNLLKIAKIAIKNHQQEILQFFGELAGKDEKIQQELGTYHKFINKGTHKEDTPEDMGDVIVPNSADGFGATGDDD